MKVRCTFDKLVPVSELKLNPKNRNIHPPDQIARLAEILNYQGWRYPVKVSLLSGLVTSGHGRVEAAIKNGWAEVPVNFQEYDSEAQEFADLTADNSIALWAELNIEGIKTDFEAFKLELDPNLLGLKDFVTEPLSPEDPEESDSGEGEPKEDPEKLLGEIQLFNGDCLIRMRSLPDNCIDSIVTDPPYGLSFMGKKWDYQVPSVQVWQEAMRILKPGGHVLSFCGTRTYHRMVVNMEDAGFEIRDQLQWIYGQGFPKSLDISKAIDKAAGIEPTVVGENPNWRPAKTHGGAGFDSAVGGGPAVMKLTSPTSLEAKQWEGWGTALKPANEPICLARKPISEKTVAANVLKWGTGGLNIDGCRIEGLIQSVPQPSFNTTGEIYNMKTGQGRNGKMSRSQGRFPSNVILDEAAGEMLDDQTKQLRAGKPANGGKAPAIRSFSVGLDQSGREDRVQVQNYEMGEVSGASRFFYCAKASKSERDTHCSELEEYSAAERTGRQEGSDGITAYAGATGAAKNYHPTVKPVSLMKYLAKLITPSNGIVLDLFMGSGTTGVACLQEGFKFVGMELDPEYFEICKKRLNWEKNQTQLINAVE